MRYTVKLELQTMLIFFIIGMLHVTFEIDYYLKNVYLNSLLALAELTLKIYLNSDFTDGSLFYLATLVQCEVKVLNSEATKPQSDTDLAWQEASVEVPAWGHKDTDKNSMQIFLSYRLNL